MTRLDQILHFLLSVDGLKEVERETSILSRLRRETVAEHSWHVALMAFLLADELDFGPIRNEVIELLLVHDLAEVIVGDQYAFATTDEETATRERDAAEILFERLPKEEAALAYGAWVDFLEGDSEASHIARAIDAAHPLLMNAANQGDAWRRHGTSADQVRDRVDRKTSSVPALHSHLRAVIERVERAGAFTTSPTTAGGPASATLERGIRNGLDTYLPVIALTLLTRESPPRVLAGVRTTHGNSTHQEVVSVPTMRVPTELARLWPEDALCARADVPGLQYTIDALLARKLGLAPAMERGSIQAIPRRIVAWQGTSLIDFRDGADVTEDLTMFNILVELDGHHELPDLTDSYEPIIWSPVDRFRAMVETRSPAALNEGLDSLELCVRGLCIETTSIMLLDEGLG